MELWLLLETMYQILISAWILPLPYTVICFLGLILPYRTTKFLEYTGIPKRRLDNLYILTISKGDNIGILYFNEDAVKRSWEANKSMEKIDPAIHYHVI
jgi:hypothetical protein